MHDMIKCFCCWGKEMSCLFSHTTCTLKIYYSQLFSEHNMWTCHKSVTTLHNVPFSPSPPPCHQNLLEAAWQVYKGVTVFRGCQSWAKTGPRPFWCRFVFPHASWFHTLDKFQTGDIFFMFFFFRPLPPLFSLFFNPSNNLKCTIPLSSRKNPVADNMCT